MIRIDLGKGSRKQGQGIRKLATKLKLQQPFEELLTRFDNDVSRLIYFLVAIGVAVLPYLFVNEYDRVVRHGYTRKIQAIDKELAVIETEISGLLPFKQELESYDVQKNQVTQRLSVIRGLLDGRNTPVNSMDAVAQSLPDGGWLEVLTYDASDKVNEKINLAGKAATNEDVSDYIDRLSQSSYLRNVKLNSVDAGPVSGFDSRSFSIDVEASPFRASPITARDVGSK